MAPLCYVTEHIVPRADWDRDVGHSECCADLRLHPGIPAEIVTSPQLQLADAWAGKEDLEGEVT